MPDKAPDQENIDRVKALHQWLASQGIHRREWGPLFSLALSQEVWFIAHGDRMVALQGQYLLTRMLVSWSDTDHLHA